MQSRSIYFNYSVLLLATLILIAGCKKEDYKLPTAKDELQNDAIKRSLGPNIVGQNIEFVYAMALPPGRGKLISAEVEASIAGAPATFLQNNSFNTNSSGVDIGVPIGQPSVNKGAITTVTFNKDTSAAALRYFYSVPEDARGQKLSFTFRAQSSNGETVTYKLGPYNVSKMDMVQNLTVSDSTGMMYVSISDMAVYNATTAATKADKIDLVFLYRTFTSAFNHALVSPAADPQYLPGITLPAGVNKSTKLRKTFNLQDQQLARLQFGIFIDDLDFQELNLSDAPNFAINLKAEAGTWVETADGKYRAYIYINSVVNRTTNKSAVISIKRYAL
ncbi:MAG: DUF4466 family protein [Chitinophagaceae bacterium]|nr:DUF4466 family protein [Chitinophagaceae bacterium]